MEQSPQTKEKNVPLNGVLPKAIREFMEMESSSGIVMILCTIFAMVCANSYLYEFYKGFVSLHIGFSLEHLEAKEPIKEWIKDILMVFFFFVVGLELKKEMVAGVLSKRDQIILPLLAAVAGMAVPAILFMVFNHSLPSAKGWAIPSATDIAFAIAILTLFAKNFPPSVKIFLLALAIFDDLGAILIIAMFYSSKLALFPLAMAFIGMGCLYILNRSHVTTVTPYILVGVFLWFCFYHAGIHTTIAGVIVGLSIPMYVNQEEQTGHSPVNMAMHFLHPWVGFIILPLFAFTASGVNLQGIELSNLFEPLPLGIIAGLFFGKQLGIFSIVWVLVKSKIISMPEDASWYHIYVVSVLAGIGFTMSLFIGGLAFKGDNHAQELIKLGVLSASLLCTLWAVILLRLKKD